MPQQIPLLMPFVFALTASSAANAIELKPCRLEASAGLPTVAAQCGTLTVAENPDDPDGRDIELFVAKVPALSAKPEPDPLTLLAGGPGQSATDLYVAIGQAFERVLRNRDIVLVDQRGTGQSQPLTCSAADTAELELADLSTLKDVTAACLKELPADPKFFTTSIAVQDLDQVRQRLNIETWNLYGASYGSRVAQHYMRRYPDRTRSVVLDGVVPADESLGPEIGLHAQAALDAVFERCAQTPACKKQFGDVSGKFWALVTQLEAAPLELETRDPTTGEHRIDLFTDLAMKAAVRLMSYGPDSAALLPLLISEAHEGDWQPLAAQAFMVIDQLENSLAYGMHNSVVCAEDVAFYGAINREELTDTYLGTQQLDTLTAVCEIWPSGPVDDDFKIPVTASVPALLLSGALDPITPPAYAERTLATLSNARHLVLPGQGHGMAPVGCTPRLIAQFISDPRPGELDAECLEREGPAPFFLTRQGPGP